MRCIILYITCKNAIVWDMSPRKLSAQRSVSKAESTLGTIAGVYHPHGSAQEMAHRLTARYRGFE